MKQSRIRMLAPLRHRDYRLLSLGTLSSLFGDGLFLVALPLQVYALSNVPTAMAVVGLVWSGAQVVTLLVGGWASDRFDRRTVMIAADVVRAAALAAIGTLALIGRLEISHLMFLGAAVGASNAFFNPAATSIVPDLLPREDLARGNAFMGFSRPLMARLLGPAAGGLIVGLAGPGMAFLLDGGTFLVSAALLSRIPRRVAEEDSSALVGGRAVHSVSEGFSFVRQNIWCWAWLVGAALGLLALTGPVDMLLPFILKNDMDLNDRQAALAFGMIVSFGGLGSIVMSVVVGQAGLPRRFLTAMYSAEIIGVSMLAIYGLMTAVWQAVLAAIILHAMFAFADIAWTTVLQSHVPRRLLGRVSSLDWMTSLGLIPLSFAIAGPLATRFGARSVLIAGAAIAACTIGALMLVPGARAPERAALQDDPVVPPA